jgi:hypothetical protein
MGRLMHRSIAQPQLLFCLKNLGHHVNGLLRTIRHDPIVSTGTSEAGAGASNSIRNNRLTARFQGRGELAISRYRDPRDRSDRRSAHDCRSIEQEGFACLALGNVAQSFPWQRREI